MSKEAASELFRICYTMGPVNVSPAGHQSKVTRGVLWTEAIQTWAPDKCTSSSLGDARDLECGRRRGAETVPLGLYMWDIRSLPFRLKVKISNLACFTESLGLCFSRLDLHRAPGGGWGGGEGVGR